MLAVVATGCGGSASKTAAAASAPSSGITVSSPANGAAVRSPFTLLASATTCATEPVTSIGYSIGGSNDPVVANGNSIDTSVPASTGTQTLHVKAWGAQGASCDQDLTIAVTDASSPENSLVPSDATVVSNVQTGSNWLAAHDPATGATSSGTMSVVSSPSLSGNARQFDTSFTNGGGEIYNVDFAIDPNSTNFFYDAWVYLSSSATNLETLELDMNQVLANGDTVIYGFQCDGVSGTWDYTANQGSLADPEDVWVHSGAPCNVQSWGKEQWHHVQISYSRDDSGNVTYSAVWLDGVEAQINATVPSVFALGWNPSLITNFQVDGNGSGSNAVYLDELTISRW